MKMNEAIQIIKPAPDCHFRLVPCQCQSENVAYVQQADSLWHVRCFDAGLCGQA